MVEFEESYMEEEGDEEETTEPEKDRNIQEQTRVVDGQILVGYQEINQKEAIKNIQKYINSYQDYQTVMRRRKTDDVFRKNIVNHITKSNDILKEIHALLIEKQMMSAWAIAERLISDIESFAREVTTHDYGFTTFFENPKLLEIDISQLYLIDYELIETLRILRERTVGFMEMVRLDYLEDVDLWFETIDRLIGRAIRLNDDRMRLIGAYERVNY
jgi:hypothetical protein